MMGEGGGTLAPEDGEYLPRPLRLLLGWVSLDHFDDTGSAGRGFFSMAYQVFISIKLRGSAKRQASPTD